MNVGKQYEKDIFNSIPDYCMKHRLRDSAQSFTTHSDTRFSWDNECDFFVFDDKRRLLYAIECKSTKYKSMSWESEQEYEQNKAIKKTSTRMTPSAIPRLIFCFIAFLYPAFFFLSIRFCSLIFFSS